MNIILFGYNGLLGSNVLNDLAQQLKKKHNFKIICVGRNIKSKPFKNRKIRYVKWDFLNFSKTDLFFFEKKNIIINCIGKNYSNSKNLREINLIFIKKLLNYIQENKISTRFIHLGSVSVYSLEKKHFDIIKNITENSKIKTSDFYSKSKLDADIIIKNTQKKNKNEFSYTILRIANVFSYEKNSNAFRFIRFLLKKGIWFKCSNNTNYHFIHAKDVTSAVLLCIFNLKNSRNKIYIVSDDINQFQLHKIYAKSYNLKLLIIPISAKLLNFLNNYLIFPRKIINFFFTITSTISYNNNKIKKELNFKTEYSLRDKII
jgi:nucleoside-diphosphate-sugar epimerase